MNRARRGFTMLIAITSLAMVGVAITLVAALANDDARRTVRERNEAQDRQLLLAGLRLVEVRLNAKETLTSGPISIPADAEATLAINAIETPSADQSIFVFSSGTLTQRATFERRAGKWSLARAELQ